MNRRQRRTSQRIVNRPELRRYTDRFAGELADILLGEFKIAKEQAEADGKSTQDIDLNGPVMARLKDKGDELASMIVKTMSEGLGRQSTGKPNVPTAYHLSKKVNPSPIPAPTIKINSTPI